MTRLIDWSIRNRGLVFALALAWLFVGLLIITRIPLDVLPEFVPPQVEIQTEAPGLSPEQVEQIVTRPIEQAVNGASGMATLRSESISGLSVVAITFQDGVDAHAVRQGISERLAQLGGRLPLGVGTPKLSPLTSSTMDVLKIGLVSDRVDAFALRDFADWTLKPKLLSVPGIARVNVFGGAVRQIHVEPDLAKLTALNLTLADLAAAARQVLQVRGLGYVDLKSQRIVITAPVPEPDPAILADAVVSLQNDVPIRLGQVAKVVLAPALEAGNAVIQGRPGVLLTISGQFAASTLEATRGLEAALAEVTPVLEKSGIRVYPALHRPATFLERALANIEQALGLAAVLILVILLLFLRNVSAAAIAFFAIPLSLVTAAVALQWAGQSVNTVTLGGFAVALGVLVDDAVIDIENIMRRLRQAGDVGDERRLGIMRDASAEIRGSMFYGTIAVVLVFLPMVWMGGVQGKFLAPLAYAFILSVAASLVVAVTVTPALCGLALRRYAKKESRWLTALKNAQGAILRGVRKAWLLAVILLIAATAASLVALSHLKAELIPQFREGHFVVQASARAAGTSLEEMMSLGERISAKLLELPFIATVEQQIGRAEAGEDTWNTHRSEFHIELKPGDDLNEEEAQEKIREVFKAYPELETETLTFLGDRISESLTGKTGQASINIIGEDLEALDHAAGDVRKAITSIAGVADINAPEVGETPELSLRLDPAKLAAFGLGAQDVLETVQSAYSGATLGQTYSGNRTVDVVMILAPSARGRLDTLGTLLVGNAKTRVMLQNVASISLSEGRTTIEREGGQRRAVLTFSAAGKSLQEVAGAVRAKLDGLEVPKGIFITVTGQAEEEIRGLYRIAAASAVALLLIVLAIASAFERRRFALLVLVNIPFGLAGSVGAMVASGTGLTLGSLAGLITVFGIAARNSIMLISHAEHIAGEEGEAWGRAAIDRAARERLLPILITAVLSGLGLIPLAMGLGRAGYEIEAPMAIAVLGGLVSATVLNLFILPEFLARSR